MVPGAGWAPIGAVRLPHPYEASHGSAKIPNEHMGSIDSRPVRELVEELLEGGKEAFEMRRLKYGF